MQIHSVQSKASDLGEVLNVTRDGLEAKKLIVLSYQVYPVSGYADYDFCIVFNCVTQAEAVQAQMAANGRLPVLPGKSPV